MNLDGESRTDLFTIRNFLVTSLIAIFLIAAGFTFLSTEKNKQGEIQIQWKHRLSGDYSFKDNWQYPEGVFFNEFEQLSCDGVCPPEIDKMKEEDGRIFHDSLTAFYRLIDTTHQFFSIQSDASCYEWAGTNIIEVTRVGNDTISCVTEATVATHSRLKLMIVNNTCIPTIELNSIYAAAGIKTFRCKSGELKIDRTMWRKGILKAEFDLAFINEQDANKPLHWKGKIFVKIGTN